MGSGSMVDVGSDFSLSGIFCHLAHSFEKSRSPESYSGTTILLSCRKPPREKAELTDLYGLRLYHSLAKSEENQRDSDT